LRPELFFAALRPELFFAELFRVVLRDRLPVEAVAAFAASVTAVRATPATVSAASAANDAASFAADAAREAAVLFVLACAISSPPIPGSGCADYSIAAG
jgi:hypothetical protein